MPSSPCDAVFTSARRHRLVLLGILVLAVGLGACGGSRLTTERASTVLQPKEQLPERELRNLPDNLIIKIDNVADDRESYKNYVVLRINGREIAPVEKISNFTSAYSYPMRLQHGVYDIKAEYHAVGYWREEVYKIVPDEAIKIAPNQRTVLEARLDKNQRGELTEKPAKFRVTYETLSADAPSAKIASPAPLPVIPFSVTANSSNILVPPLRNSDPAAPVAEKLPAAPRSMPLPQTPAPEPAKNIPATSALATLQINTSPAGADVIVDDRYYGQAPVKITVDKQQNHVIQISQQGYKEVVKIVNAADLQSEPIMQMIIKLEALGSAKSSE